MKNRKDKVMKTNKTLELRKKLNSGKKYLKDIMPTKQVVEARLSTYTSTDTNITEYDGKLYADPIYSEELPMAVSTFAILHGDWLLDEELGDFGEVILKIIDNKSGQYIKIGFPDQINKLKFLNEIHTTQPIRQENSGMNISGVVNDNTLHEKKNNLVKLGIASIIAGIGFLAFSKKSKK